MAGPLPPSAVRGLLLLLGSASRANGRELGSWLSAVGPCREAMGRGGRRLPYRWAGAERVRLGNWGA
jgi:hypothetical protein